MASFIMGIKILLATNPGASLTRTGILFNDFDSSMILLVVSFEVTLPLMTSTNFIIGTGFMKCIPITFSGLFVALAISEIDMEEVLLANIVSGLHNSSNS